MSVFKALAVAGAAFTMALTVTPAWATAQSYDDCPYGRACLFDQLDGGHLMFIAPSCGEHGLPAETWGRTLSARTHGNGVDLYNVRMAGGAPPVDHLSPWQQRNVATGVNLGRLIVLC